MDTQPKQATTVERTTGNNRGLTQAYMLRDLAAQEAFELHDAPLTEMETRSSRAQALSALIRGWETAIDRIRIIRGRPLPGSYKPERQSTLKRLKSESSPDRLVPMLESAEKVSSTEKPDDLPR